MSTSGFDEQAWLRWLHAVLTGRGWQLHAQDAAAAGGASDSAQPSWFYRDSFAGRIPQPIEDIAPQPLECFPALSVGPTGGGLLLVHAGNESGCPLHARSEQQLGLPERDTDLPAALAPAERHAGSLDPRDLLECRFFGACGAAWDSVGARRD